MYQLYTALIVRPVGDEGAVVSVVVAVEDGGVGEDVGDGGRGEEEGELRVEGIV